MNKTLTIIIVLLILGFGAWYFLKGAPASAPETGDENATLDANNASGSTVQGEDESGTAIDTDVSVDITTPAVREFTITGSNFAFDVSSIKVKQGDTVKITFVNSVGSHDLRVEGYGIGTKILAAGARETISFTADEKGTFEYYCSVGSHRAMGMKGSLIVE